MTEYKEPTKAGWRPAEWGRDVGVSRAQVYNYLNDGIIKSKKAGNARIITTPPREFLASLPDA